MKNKVLILSNGKSGTKKLSSLFLNYSLLDSYLKQLKNFEIHLSISKQDTQIKLINKRIILEIEDKRLGNAIAVKNFALKYKEDFVCIYNNIFTSIDFISFVEQAKQKRNDCFETLLVSKNIGKANAFGILTFGKNKEVLSLTTRRYTNCGIFYFKKSIIDYIKPPISKISYLLERLIDIHKLGVFTFKGLWYQINNEQKRKFAVNNMRSKNELY